MAPRAKNPPLKGETADLPAVPRVFAWVPHGYWCVVCSRDAMSRMSPRLLLVDDHALYLTGLRLMLAEGWPQADVALAHDWREATSAVETGRPDLVLLDVHLPDADGLGVLPSLLERHPGLKVLLMSADVGPALIRQAREAGACGYLHKSAGPQEVIQAVSACLDHGAAWALLPYAWAEPAPAVPQGVAEPSSLAEDGSLRPLQCALLREVSRGASNRAIARALALSETDVRAELSWVTERLGALSREQAVALAQARGLLS